MSKYVFVTTLQMLKHISFSSAWKTIAEVIPVVNLTDTKVLKTQSFRSSKEIFVQRDFCITKQRCIF